MVDYYPPWGFYYKVEFSISKNKDDIRFQAVSGLSVAIFYASGIVFAVSAGVLLLREIWRTLSGQLRDEELVMVQESEALAQVHGEPGDGARK